MPDKITPVDQECVEVMTAIWAWLDHWTDVLAERDGPTHVPDFITSMQALCYRLLEILEPEEDTRNEYEPTRDGATH